MDSQYKQLGMAIGAAAHGEDTRSLWYKQAAVETMANRDVEGYGAIQRIVCKYASEAYKECGKMKTYNYHVFSKLAKATPWFPELDEYYDAAVSALGKVHGTIRKEAHATEMEAVFEKRAINLLSNLAAGVGRVSPEAMKVMLASGALAGLTGGSTAWLMNRGVTEDAPKLEAMKERINYYNQLTNEIENELQRKGVGSEEEAYDTINEII